MLLSSALKERIIEERLNGCPVRTIATKYHINKDTSTSVMHNKDNAELIKKIKLDIQNKLLRVTKSSLRLINPKKLEKEPAHRLMGIAKDGVQTNNMIENIADTGQGQTTNFLQLIQNINFMDTSQKAKKEFIESDVNEK